MGRSIKVVPEGSKGDILPPAPPLPEKNDGTNVGEDGIDNNASTEIEFHYPTKVLNELRRALDQKDEDDIKQMLIIFEQMVELFRTKVPGMKAIDRISWALPAAINPDWYHGKLSDRLQNVILVSSLFVTSTAVGFIYPPPFDKDSWAFRTFIYLNGLSTILFLISIVFGIFFIENAMNRTYGESERMVLICRFYSYKTVCQTTMVMGAIIFPITMVIPIWDVFLKTDAYAIVALTGVFTFVTIQLIYTSTANASAELTTRASLMARLCDAEGFLKPEYFPQDQNITREDIKLTLNWIADDEFKPMTYGLGLTNKDEEEKKT